MKKIVMSANLQGNP